MLSSRHFPVGLPRARRAHASSTHVLWTHARGGGVMRTHGWFALRCCVAVAAAHSPEPRRTRRCSRTSRLPALCACARTWQPHARLTARSSLPGPEPTGRIACDAEMRVGVVRTPGESSKYPRGSGPLAVGGAHIGLGGATGSAYSSAEPRPLRSCCQWACSCCQWQRPIPRRSLLCLTARVVPFKLEVLVA
jgi:hypothetical protein